MYRETENFSLISPYHTPITLALLDTLVFSNFNVPIEWWKRKEHSVPIYGGLFFALHKCIEFETAILLCSEKNNPP